LDICNGLREDFAPIAHRYRFVGKMACCLIIGAIACALLSFVLPKAALIWAMTVFVICLIGTLTTVAFLPELKCPNCDNRLDQGLGPFCPECGAKALDAPGWFRMPHCSACGRDMRVSKGRRYRIRACALCGLWLD